MTERGAPGPLDAYLERLGYSAPVAPDLATLVALHRAHITTIPYENLEIQLGRENVLDEPAFAAKLVDARRGGWCYEMNGLLTAMLRATPISRIETMCRVSPTPITSTTAPSKSSHCSAVTLA